MTDLPSINGGFQTILADPAWSFRTYGKNGHGKSPEKHYETMSLAQIKAMPVGEIAAKDAFLLMWTTWPCLNQALEVIDAWSFTYKTGGAWGKLSKTGRKLQFGTGYLFRSASEPLLVATRGKPKWGSRSERNLWLAPVREHSRKPDCVHEMIERACPGPHLELFARAPRPGWTVWGNQTELFAEAA